MSRKKVDRGVYEVSSCSCHLLPKRHTVFDVVVSTGFDQVAGGYGQVWRRHHGNLTTARGFRTSLLTARAEGSLKPSSRHTLNALFDAWLADLERLDAAPKTIGDYRRDAKQHWRTPLGERPLHRISRADVRAVTNALIDKGTGVHHALSTISAAFTWAVQEGWIGAHEDPTKKIPRPAKVSRLPQVPTPDQVRAVIALALEVGLEPMSRFLFLGAITGCRMSELRGLRIRDIDLSAGVIGLITAMSAEVEWTLKNRHERPVGLDDLTVGFVRAQIAWMEDRARDANVTLRDDAFLFSDDPYGATHWREQPVSRLASTLFDHVDQPEGEPCTHRPGEPCPRPGPLAHFTFKALRKFMTTYGQQLGYGTGTTAARAGHDPAVAARVYTGVVEKTDRALSAGLAALLVPTEDSSLAENPVPLLEVVGKVEA